MATPVVAMVGLRALNRDLNRLADDRGPLNAAFRQAGRAAIEPIANAARAAVPSDSGTLSGTIRTNASRSGATVRMGTSKVRYAGWVEFGGNRHRPHDSSRDFIRDGRFLFPAARPLAASAATAYTAALNEALGAFDWTNQGDNGAAVHD
jgi:hypothetical protein